MSASVDVLVVFDKILRAAHCIDVQPPPDDEVSDARAAVVELIEAAVNVHAACRAGKEPDLIALADVLDGMGAKEARKAALARIGGAA